MKNRYNNLALTIVSTIYFSNTIFSQTPELNYIQELVGPPTMGCCPTNSSGNYQVVFREDFNGNSIDTSEWRTGTGCYWTVSSVPNSEAVYFGDVGQNIFVENGVLKLKADTLFPGIQCANKIAHYSVGQLITNKQWRYGKFEIRFKIPDSGSAIYPAIWMQSNTNDSKDEIDIIEAYGWHDWENGGLGMHYSSGSLNSVTNSFDCYGQNVESSENNVLLIPNEWHITTLEWTPYYMLIKLDGNVINEMFRYYKICNGEAIGINCEIDQACSAEKYIENMSFPDDYMNVKFWLNLQPTIDWWGETIFETNTVFPSIMEIDYLQVEQLPKNTWKECENKMFCTYSIENNKEDTLKSCFSSLGTNPNIFHLHPKGLKWDEFPLTHSNNIFPTVVQNQYTPDSYNIRPNPNQEATTEWFQFEISENANSTCIGQDRLFKKIIKYNEFFQLPLITLDDVAVSTENKTYKVKLGTHKIKLENPIPNGVLNHTITVSTNYAQTYTSTNGELSFDVLYSNFVGNVFVTFKLENGCSHTLIFSIASLCSDNDFQLTSNGINYTQTPYATEQKHELCFGSHTFTLTGQASLYTVYNSQFLYIPITNNSFTITPTANVVYYFVDVLTKENCHEKVRLDISGLCCHPGHTCNGNCALEAYPNPASSSLVINAPVIGEFSGTSYIPVIRQVNVYNRYMQQVKTVSPGDLTTYNLDVMDLLNNEFYIVESKDQHNNACRKTIMITR